MAAIVAVAVAVLIVIVGVAAVLTSRSGDSSEEASGDTSSTTTEAVAPSTTAEAPTTTDRGASPPTTAPAPSTTAAPTTAAPTAPPPSGDGGVPSGLFCRDLVARGFSYDAAVAYWFQQGQPDQMDEDLDGIPCETVYPASDVEAYFGPGEEGVPSGLFCRDLVARGFSYDAAVAYWFQEGEPDRMDEDLNGIPCETLYPESDIQSVFG